MYLQHCSLHTETEQESPGNEGAEEEALGAAEAEGSFREQPEAEQQALRAKVAELQEANQELCEELQKTKHDYSMAAGALSAVQRQLEIQESQLRRTRSEKETLQKELRERENQLQAMSAKFCSLREEWKHAEMMATMERENCSLRQTVTKQESQLAEQNQVISDLQSAVSQLQAKVLVNEYHIQEQQRAQEAIQSQADLLQHTEQQTKVALQSITSRFERYRSKIIQATFSAAGSKCPQAELTDEEVLEAMQKIINERMEFHQMLKQKGVKVPSLYSPDTPTSALANSRSSRKSPQK
ncbi:coiled-coil domain-containing protein 27 [Nothoprocta perdicaria]|uniref:coiled-coil domain-containing protein 27 n=1 Tax=Nothoprocta perdicaria TaxID=30464 RepID=UPI000E1C0983|nr:coiled-coil domain-containing protein 27 [Nothoprocta perdicaria]